MKTLKKKLLVLQILSFVFSILPLVIVLVINGDKYFHSASDCVRLSFAGVILVFMLILKTMGKLKLPEHRITTFGFVFLMAYLTKSVADDLLLLSGMALLGELLDFLFFDFQIQNLREQIRDTKTAKIVASELKDSVINSRF